MPLRKTRSRSRRRSRKNLRTFTDIKNNGRYISKDPVSAAKKAGRQHIKRSIKKAKVITIRETTNGSAKKEYTYKVKKVNLKCPIIIKRKDGSTTVYKRKIVAKSMN